jgi:hypothetical protein
LLYASDFASTNSDFYTNKERRELDGCLVLNMLAQQYLLKVSFVFLLSFQFVVCICTSNPLTVHVLYSSSQDGQQVFVSKRSFNDGVKNLVQLAQSDKLVLRSFQSQRPERILPSGFNKVIPRLGLKVNTSCAIQQMAPPMLSPPVWSSRP